MIEILSNHLVGGSTKNRYCNKSNEKEWISNLILRDVVIDVFVLNVSQENMRNKKKSNFGHPMVTHVWLFLKTTVI